jgi:ribonuclease HI
VWFAIYYLAKTVQVKKFPNAKFKSFVKKEDAESYLRETSKKKKKDGANDEPRPKKRQKAGNPVSSTTKAVWFHMTFDGGSRGNPGLSGAGAEVITRFKQTNQSDIKRTKTKIRKALEGSQTNNQAEFEGVISGLEYVLKALTEMTEEPYPHVTLVVQGDSNLIIQQLEGNYKCNSDKLKPLYRQAKELVTRIEEMSGTFDVTYEHVYRKDNAAADGAYFISKSQRSFKEGSHLYNNP